MPVTLAGVLMILMAGVGLVYAVVGLAIMNGTVNRFRAAAAGTSASASDVDAVVALVRATAIVAALVGVPVAVLLTVLALGNLRGNNPARIATWVVAGAGLICGCCSLGTIVGQWVLPMARLRYGEVPADLMRSLADAYPSWWIGLSGALSAGQALGYVVVAVLLALPAANSFFRRRPPAQWQPPFPFTPSPSAPPPL